MGLVATRRRPVQDPVRLSAEYDQAPFDLFP